MNIRKALIYLAFLGIGVLLFYMAFSMIDDREALWNDMRSASWGGLIVSFVMGYLAIVSRGLRWVIMLDPLGHKPSPLRTVHAVTFAYFANTFIPRSGELARCAALNQTDDIPVDQLFGTVISERVVDFVILIALTTIAIIANIPAFLELLEGAEMPDATNAIAGAGGMLLVLGLLWLKRKSLLELPFARKVASFLKGIWEGLNSIRANEAERDVLVPHLLHLEHVLLDGLGDFQIHRVGCVHFDYGGPVHHGGWRVWNGHARAGWGRSLSLGGDARFLGFGVCARIGIRGCQRDLDDANSDDCCHRWHCLPRFDVVSDSSRPRAPF